MAAAIARSHPLSMTSDSTAHDTWQLLAPMPTARFGAVAGAIGSSVYVAGGYGANGILGITEAYSSTTNSWKTGLARMNYPRWAFAAAVVGNVLYTFGGATTSQTSSTFVESYNPAADKWTIDKAMPVGTNSNSAAVYKGNIYVVGGYNSSSGRLSIVQEYDPQTNTWASPEPKPMNLARSGLGLGSTGALIVAAEGLSSGATTDTEGYSPTQNAWSKLPSSPRADFNVCSGANLSSLYVAGGTTGGAAGGPPLAYLDIYDATTKTWAAGQSMKYPVILSASAVLSGKLLCIGGSDSSFPGASYYDYVQEYQP